jgi:hypothetical protein
VLGRLDDHLVSADAVHAIVHTVADATDRAFDLESGEFVGDDPNPPAGGVALGAGVAIGQYLRRRVVFLAATKRTERRFQLLVARYVGAGTLGALGRNNHPPADNRVFAEFRHLFAIRKSLRELEQSKGFTSAF